jgi:hypothetical protein
MRKTLVFVAILWETGTPPEDSFTVTIGVK